jgi:hypothetical protein
MVFLFWQEREKFCTSTQALLLLRCCGDLLTGKPHTVALLFLVEFGSGFFPSVTRSEFEFYDLGSRFLVRIRIRGSVPMTNVSGSSFRSRYSFRR